MNALVRKLTRFSDKDYRDGYLHTRVRAGIAYQMRALRKKFGLSQSEMATRTEKTQSVISRLEDEEYGRVSVQTLLDVASALDVALLVQFVSYPEFIKRSADMSEKALQPETIHESLTRGSPLYRWPSSMEQQGSKVVFDAVEDDQTGAPLVRPPNLDVRPQAVLQ